MISFLEVFAQKRDWNGGVAKLIVTKYSAPQKAIIGGCGIKAEKEHQYPILRSGKDKILRGIVYQKSVEQCFCKSYKLFLLFWHVCQEHQAQKSSKIFTTLPECHWAAGGESWSFRTSDRI